MSHKSKRGARRVKVACATCRANLPATAAALLQQAADALNACRRAGLDLKVRHGIIECREGLLIPLADGTIAARTRAYTEFPDGPADEGDDLG